MSSEKKERVMDGVGGSTVTGSCVGRLVCNENELDGECAVYRRGLDLQHGSRDLSMGNETELVKESPDT
jgi:hypothetical protein